MFPIGCSHPLVDPLPTLLRVRKLLLKAKDCRRAGHIRMARMLYTYISSGYDPKVPGVTEAEDRLKALPKEDDR